MTDKEAKHPQTGLETTRRSLIPKIGRRAAELNPASGEGDMPDWLQDWAKRGKTVAAISRPLLTLADVNCALYRVPDWGYGIRTQDEELIAARWPKVIPYADCRRRYQEKLAAVQKLWSPDGFGGGQAA